ncbi:MAG: ectoine hydroxylase [Motiliproteus sp.]
METEGIFSTQSSNCKDAYPSRGGRKAALVERLDPVVYAPDLNQSPVAPALVEQYKNRGFLILEDVFDASEVEVFQRELDKICDDPQLKDSDKTITEPDSGSIRSVFQIHQFNPIFKRLAADVRLAGLAQFLLNDQVYIHQSRLNYKPGFVGKEFYWHSDFETWHVEDGMPRMRALSISITLTENYPFNGPLMLIPGSHKRYVVCEGETPEGHYKASLKKQELGVPSDKSLSSLVNQSEIVTATGKPGSLILFDCNLMHGSNGNITPFPRSNVFFVYNALSNRIVEPFCGNAPRPEHICSRTHIEPIAL